MEKQAAQLPVWTSAAPTKAAPTWRTRWVVFVCFLTLVLGLTQHLRVIDLAAPYFSHEADITAFGAVQPLSVDRTNEQPFHRSATKTSPSLQKRATTTRHAQLAAASGMKPAALASLPFPTSALSKTPAMEWIKKHWNWTSGTSDFIAFVADPFGSNDIVLRVMYPKGSYAHDVPGGAGFYLDVFGDAVPLRSLLSYQVALSPNFDFVKGGKLPGLYGGDHAGGCSGGLNSDLCFSLRVLWRAQGAGEIYAYLPGTYPGFCDTAFVSCNLAGFGTSLGRSTWDYSSSLGAWSTVVESAVLNSDPAINGTGTARANGYISTYFNPSGEDAKLAFSKKQVVFRTREEVGFSSLFFSTFFGGGSEDYASSANVYAYFKDFNVYAGTGDSNASGAVVTVS